MKRALVTGGAGFIGSHLSAALLQQNIEVVVLDNLSVGRKENLPEGVEFIQGNILNSTVVNQAFQGVDVVFHLAAKVSIRGSVENFFDDAEQNVMGTLSVLRGLKISNAGQFIFASSMAVYDDRSDPVPIGEDYSKTPRSPYGISKLCCENYIISICGMLGIKANVLRYFNTYGTRQTYSPYVGVITIFARRLLNGNRPTIFGDGNQNRDFVSVKDIVQANLLVMNSNECANIYNVGTSKATSVNEISEIMCRIIDPSIRPEYGECRSEELRNSIADITAIRRDLAYEPKSDINCDLEDVVDYIRSTLPTT